MTRTEAERVAKIIGTADNACGSCVGGLVGLANAAFPDWAWKLAPGDQQVEYYTDDWTLVPKTDEEPWERGSVGALLVTVKPRP